MKYKAIKKVLCLSGIMCSIISTTVFADFEEISKGTTGDKVIEVQKYLIEQGFLNGEADGNFGSGTEEAVKIFQESNELNCTGVIDEETYNYLSGNIEPTELIDIDVSRVRPVTFDSGMDHVLGLSETGEVVAIFEGNNEKDNRGQCDVESWKDIISISAGGAHSVGLKSNGTVTAIGYNEDGQCNVKSWTGIIDIATGYQHSVGLKMDGTVVSVGNNDNGQCNTESWTDIVDVATGSWHTIGVRSDGTVVATGHNEYGQCEVDNWTDIVSIEGNNWCTVGLKADGTVVYAGGYHKDDYATLSHWNDIVYISAYDSDAVYGIKSDGSIVSSVEGKGIVNEACMAVTYASRPCFLLADGSVKYRNSDVMSDMKLRKPYHHTIDKVDTINQDTGNWIMIPYVDEFNLPTDEYYIVNNVVFEGTFSNSATKNSLLNAYLFCSGKEYGSDSIAVRLIEYGEYIVNNSYSDTCEYDIVVMDCDGNKYYMDGKMYSDGDKIYFSDEQTVVDVLKKGGTVRFAISEKESSLNSYIITIEDATGFDAIYYQYWAD